MRLITGLLLCLCATSAPMRGQDDAESQPKIIALEKAWNQAYKSGDTNALDSLLDDSAVLINHDGLVQTKADFLGSLKATSSSQDHQLAPESITVHMHGPQVAIATGVFEVRGVDAAKRTSGATALSIRGSSRMANGYALQQTLSRYYVSSASMIEPHIAS